MATLLEQEIRQQGAVLQSRAMAGIAAANEVASLLGRADVEHVLVAARGSSDNAARFAQYLLGGELRLQASLAAPWLFRQCDKAPWLSGAAVIAISQSGRSPDIVSVLEVARAQGRPTVAITANPGSTLAEFADCVVPLLTGEEHSVAATKTYLSSVHAIVQIVEAMSPDASRRQWLARLPRLVDRLCEEMVAERERFAGLADARLITVTGRGMMYAAACESALKLRELTYTPAEAFSPPDLMHGPVAGLHHSGAAWMIEPGDEAEQISPLVGLKVVVSSDVSKLAAASIPVQLPADLPDWLFSMLAVIPAQAAALGLAERAGIDVDHPRRLHKVTLTW